MAAHSTTTLPNGNTLTIVERGPHNFSVQERENGHGPAKHVKQAYHLSEAEAYVRARKYGKTRRALMAERRAKVNQVKDAKLREANRRRKRYGT